MKKVGGIIKGVFPRASVISVKQLKKGGVNKIFEIKIINPDKELILRLFPKRGWKAVKEAYIYNLISKKTNVPVPRVYLADSSKKLSSYPFTLLSKIDGNKLTEKDGKLIEKAGEYLAQLNKVSFNRFGWIVGKKIEPCFSKWIDFCEYDLKYKLKDLKKYKKVSNDLIKRVEDYFNKNKYLLNIKTKPCLLHKDYHFSHILVNKDGIAGIIDVEWAISGHNELDITKSLLWMFGKNKELERIFLRGYKRYNTISKEFPKRRKLYELLIVVSSVLFSCELHHNRWFNHNIKRLYGIIKK